MAIAIDQATHTSRTSSGISAITRAFLILGAAWLALMVYAWGSWIMSPDFTPNTFGRDQAPQWYVQLVHSVEIGSVVVTIVLLYVFFLKPWIRDRRLGFDALFLLAVASAYIQEPWLNAVRPQLLYSTVFINYGCWMGQLPGIVSPVAQKVPIPILSWTLSYLYIVAFPAYLGSRFMGWLRSRNPSLSPWRLVLGCFAMIFAFDFTLEFACTRIGLLTYISTVKSLTLFAGEPHQLPMYEFVHWCGTYTAWSCIHFFRNDKGESWADRGVALLNIPQTLKTFVRWVCLMGLCQTTMLLIYNIPFSFWALQGDKPVVTEAARPWMTAGLCGPSTPYDCNGPGVPIALRDSPTNRLHASPTATR